MLNFTALQRACFSLCRTLRHFVSFQACKKKFQTTKLFSNSDTHFLPYRHCASLHSLEYNLVVAHACSDSFWKIYFPLHSRSYQVSNKMKYIHLGIVVLGVLLPFISVVAIMSEFAVRVKSTDGDFVSGGLGFIVPRFPPIPCHGRSKNVVFYSHILLLYVLLSTGITLTFLIMWRIHKVS